MVLIIILVAVIVLLAMSQKTAAPVAMSAPYVEPEQPVLIKPASKVVAGSYKPGYVANGSQKKYEAPAVSPGVYVAPAVSPAVSPGIFAPVNIVLDEKASQSLDRLVAFGTSISVIQQTPVILSGSAGGGGSKHRYDKLLK